MPVSCLSEEIATPGEGQIKGLVTIAGNPVISSPEAEALNEAPAASGVHDFHRQLAERNHPPCACDSAGLVASGAAPLRRDDMVVGHAKRGQLLSCSLPALCGSP